MYCDLDNRGVGFGFVDSITHTGELLFCSVLKYRAAKELAELHQLIGNEAKVSEYNSIAERIRSSIPATFSSKGDLLRASTAKSCQPDVWGSAFAVYVGALEAKQAEAVCLCCTAGRVGGSTGGAAATVTVLRSEGFALRNLLRSR